MQQHIIFAFLLAVSTTVAQPLHAHCYLDLNFPSTSCDALWEYLVDQIENFDIPEVREPDYELVASNKTDGSIVAIHTTPVKKYVDDISFGLVNNAGGCAVKAESTSRPISYYDYDTNYCNIWNLLRKATWTYAESVRDCTLFVCDGSDDAEGRDHRQVEAQG